MNTPLVSFDGKDCSGCKHLNERGYCEFTACIIPCTVRATIPEVKPRTNADLIRSADTEIGMVDLILKLVKKIPEGEDKRRTLYQLLEQEAT